MKVNLLTLSASPHRLKYTVVSVARPTNTSATSKQVVVDVEYTATQFWLLTVLVSIGLYLIRWSWVWSIPPRSFGC